MLNEFKIHIENQFPELCKNKFLLACSGGIDSIVLVHLCHALDLNFALAHCNFQLRGSDSDADAEFVVELAKNTNIECFATIFDTVDYVLKNKVSIQVAARELRYAWFAKLMQENKIGTLVTAHQADDNLETFLINLSRGTGIDGLTGIPARTEDISRPLLPFSRVQVVDYATANDIRWREDSSNAETKYLRNKIRHHIAPLLKELHPTFSANFLKTLTYLMQTSEIAETHFDTLKNSIFIREEGDVIKIPIASLLTLKPLEAHLYGLLKVYGFTEWGDVKKLLSAISGKEVRSKTHRLLKDREHLILTKQHDKVDQSYQLNENVDQISSPIRLTIETVAVLGQTGKNILYVDKKTLKYPLVIRKWQKGDYFYPIGMQGKKKLSKYFKDEKINVVSKEEQWLLCSDNAIVWVIGKRPDNRFIVTKSTKNILKFIVN